MALPFDDDFNADDLNVKISELLIATSDHSDQAIDAAVPTVLRLLREHMGMDVVFVSEFINGQRVFHHVDSVSRTAGVEVGGADPLEASWCQRVVDGRLPEFIPNLVEIPADKQPPAAAFPIGTHLSTPIVLSNGHVYGTLCCFSHGVNARVTERDLRHLRYTAQLTAGKIERESVDPGLVKASA